MKRNEVQSSQVKSVGYDAGLNTLEIEFQSGQVHEFYGVTAADHNAFINASSMGSHFMQQIRDKHPSRQLQ